MWLVTRLDEEPNPVQHVTDLASRLDLPRWPTTAWVAAQTLQLYSWLQISNEAGPLELYRSAGRALLTAIG